MKTVVMIVTALMVTAASSAFAQNNTDLCHSSMIPCLDMCTQRPSKSLQDSCARTCESNANACYSDMYGARSNARPATPQDALNSAAPDTRKSKSVR